MYNTSPESVLEYKELRVLFWRTVWSMPDNLRKVITHLYICDRPIEEAAVLMGTTNVGANLLHSMAIEDLRERVKYWL